MIVFLSGSHGFLGSELYRELSGRYTVIRLLRPEAETDFFRYPENLQPDLVIHCHAVVSSGTFQADADALYRGNVLATRELVTRYPDARHLYFSSVSVYGFPDAVITEDSPVRPPSIYAETKLEAESVFSDLADATVIRLSSLYGPGMKENTLIPNYVNQALAQGVMEVWGDGSRLQNYISVSDVAGLVGSMLSATNLPKMLLGVSQQSVTNLEIARTIAEITGAEIRFVRSDASPSVRFDNSFTRKTLTWHPQTGIRQGLLQYIAWKKKQS